MVDIIPSLLTNDPKELMDKIRALEGIVSRIQVDIIDGVYADNRTVAPDVLGQIETSLLIDFHLMTKEPIDWVERCGQGQAGRIIGQIEQMSSQREFIEKVAGVGAKIGLAIDLETLVLAIDKVVLVNLDVVLLMSVKAGFGGQEFDARVLDKIRKLKEIKSHTDLPFRICVDGGIDENNIAEVVAAGADEVSIGNKLFEGNVSENIKMMQEKAL